MAYAYNIYSAGSSQTDYTISFPYIKEEHVKVYVNYVDTSFTFHNATTARLASAPSSGTRVEVRRVTPPSAVLVDYADGSTLTASDLDTSNLQHLYIAQELDDSLKQGISISASTGLPTLGSQRLTNVADPTAAQDAATKNYVDTTRQPVDAELTELATMSSGTASSLADLTNTEVQILDGATVTTAEVNLLDGVTATTAEINYVDGVTSNVQTQLNAKQPLEVELTELATMASDTASSLADLTAAEVQALDGVTASTAELNILDGVTSTTAEINKLDGVTASTAELNILDGVTATAAEINLIDGVTATTAELNYVDGVASNIQTQLDAKQPLDSELTTLSGMQGGTASILASGTALGATTAEINSVCENRASQTTITDDDAKIPTSGAVVDYVAAQIAPLGGLEVVATEVAFPNTQPSSGVVISISDAGGVVINGSGVSTTGRTVGGTTVTINGFPSSLYSETLVAGVGLMVSSTGSSQTYNYHKILGKEDDIKQLSDDINDFNARYRVGSSNPSSALDAGDLFFNTGTNKLLVYNATNTAWEEAQSIGNFYISTFSESFDGSRTDFTLSNAPTNAQQVIISINGVIQKPNAGTSTPSEGFALSGNTVKLSNAPASGSSYFAYVMGSTVNIGTPSNNTVSTVIIQNGAVNTDKLGADAVNGDKIADDAVGAEHIEVLDAALQFGDSVKAQFGAQPDLEIYHTGSHGYITENTGNLKISAASGPVQILKGSSENIATFTPDGSCELYYDNSKKLSTLASGIKVERTDATQSYITMATSAGDCGFLYANSNTDIQLMDREGHPFLKGIKDGAVELYWDNAKRLSTWSDSVNIYGDEGADAILHLYADEGDDNADKWRTRVSASSGTFNIENYTSGSWESNIIATGNGAVSLYYNNILTCYTSNGCLAFPDSQAIFMGADNDLQIVHDGSNSIIKDNGTGDLQLRAENFRVQNKEGTSSIVHGNAGAAVELYHNGTKRFETTSTGFGGLGYFNAGPSSNAGNSYHDIRSENNGQWLATFRHATTSSAPYGIWLGFTGASPDTNGHEFIRFDDSTAQRFRVNSDGDIYTHDSGTINSDRTMKENIVDASPKLDDLMKLKVRNFSWKKEFHPAKEGEKKIGFIAQEVEEVFPKLVNESNIAPLDKPDVLKKEIKQAWAPIIIKALQEAVTKIETLEAKVAALESA